MVEITTQISHRLVHDLESSGVSSDTYAERGNEIVVVISWTAKAEIHVRFVRPALNSLARLHN